VFHIHGDHDKVVPLATNSEELVRRYRRLGGSAELVVVKGLGHGGAPFSHSQQLAAFLLAD
jgi:dipeptidyl aminopeptidase/acylaminoacyl peptidase